MKTTLFVIAAIITLLCVAASAKKNYEPEIVSTFSDFGVSMENIRSYKKDGNTIIFDLKEKSGNEFVLNKYRIDMQSSTMTHVVLVNAPYGGI